MELRLYIPTAWNQLNRKQLLFMASLYSFNHGEMDFLTKALLYLTGLKLKSHSGGDSPPDSWAVPDEGGGGGIFTHPSIKIPVIITVEEITIMCNQCRYLLDVDEIKPLKWIRFARARHPRLYNASLEEYLMAENYYFAYTKTRDDQHLHNLMSVLYRTPWQRWDAGKIQTRSTRFAKLEKNIKISVLMWYVGFRSYIPKRCPTLFSGRISGDFDVRNYITGIVHQLNNGNITINEKLLRSAMWDALDEMEQRAKEAEETEKAMKRK